MDSEQTEAQDLASIMNAKTERYKALTESLYCLDTLRKLPSQFQENIGKWVQDTLEAMSRIAGGE